MSEENDDVSRYFLTKNVIQSGKTFGINNRNWVEAIVFSIICVWLVRQVNFVSDVKMVVSIMTFLVVFIFSLMGIKNRSVTEILIAEYRYRKRRRRLHLTDAATPRKGYKDDENEGLSNFERTVKFFKTKYSQFIEKYSE